MDTAAYLKRIDYDGSVEISSEVLRELHYAHLLSVPFENLDIHLGREIMLDQSSLFNKIVNERRGNFYWLNSWIGLLTHRSSEW